MDILGEILKQIRLVIREEIQNIHFQEQDRWLNKKQLAKYWGVSESYINKHIEDIPHSLQTPISFKQSEADAWRKGFKELEIQKQTIKSYKANNFKIKG